MEVTARVRADYGRGGYVEVKLWAGRLRGCYGEGYVGGHGKGTGGLRAGSLRGGYGGG